ncbi:hypothetical protein Tco_0045595 [Tanacetum coccineum]
MDTPYPMEVDTPYSVIDQNSAQIRRIFLDGYDTLFDVIKSLIDYVPENEITSDSNIISYEQYLQESQNVVVQDTNSSAQQDAMIMSVFEQMSNQVTNCDKINQENKLVNESLTAELERYKERVKIFEQRLNIDLSSREKFIDSQIDDMIVNRNALKQEIDPLKQTLLKMLRKRNKHIENLKGKNVAEKDLPPNNAKVIAPGMFKLDLEPLSPKLLKNKDAYIDYIKHTQKHADTLQELIEHARALRPLDNDLDYACKYAKRIQEVLIYVTATCPSLTKPGEKLVAITPLNKNKKASSTSASRSQPSGNKKQNRILQTTSSNQKNKVEDHPRSIKMNRVIEPICNANVKHSMLNANSKLICATCNECMFDAIHDVCVLDFVNDVNVRSKFKSSKRSKKKTTWKHIGKVSTNVGYKWIPRGQKFTLDGNRCPLTRITSNNVVPPKNPLLTKVTKKTIPCRKNPEMLKEDTNISSSSRSKVVESNISNNSKPSQNWGSNVSTALSSSLVNFRLSKLFSGKSKKHSHKPKAEDSFQEKLYLLHMDLYGPMRIQSINRQKYIFVIVDD